MKEELWLKVEELFHAALERVPEARQAFLNATCGADIDLRRRSKCYWRRKSKPEGAG